MDELSYFTKFFERKFTKVEPFSAYFLSITEKKNIFTIISLLVGSDLGDKKQHVLEPCELCFNCWWPT